MVVVLLVRPKIVVDLATKRRLVADASMPVASKIGVSLTASQEQVLLSRMTPKAARSKMRLLAGVANQP